MTPAELRAEGEKLTAPFPWFGGKSRAAHLIWERFGDVPNYIEPFAGSLAVLLGRPHVPKTETVNDLDCYLVNFWRAIQADPDTVAYWADWPVTEADQNARHLWLVSRAEFRERMNTDPDYYCPKIAGWWVWGQNIWIGTGWCSGRFYRGNPGTGIHRQLPHLGDSGTGVHRKLPHLGDSGRGVHRKLPHLGDSGTGVHLSQWFDLLSTRLRRVRVCCGDWTRVLTPSVTTKHGVTAVLLDPPYATANNAEYATDSSVAPEVKVWAIENGHNPLFRIALCGYEGEQEIPENWTVVEWRARKGYQSVNENGTHTGHLERIWFSPNCLSGKQGVLKFETSRPSK